MIKNGHWNTSTKNQSHGLPALIISAFTLRIMSTLMKPNIIIFSLLFTLFNLSSAAATSLRPISLEQLSTRATLIFFGEVLNNKVKKDQQSGQIVTFTEFKVIDLIKGDAGKTHTIKQIGGFLKNSNTTLRIHGVPKFQVGNSYVVFLPTKSKLGFSSPLGLHQGRFSVLNINGEQVISNGRGLNNQSQGERLQQNSRVVQIPLAVRTDNPSQSRLDDFINTVRGYNTPLQ